MTDHLPVPGHAAHSLTGAETLAALDSTAGGLSDLEAQARLAAYGPNRLPEPQGASLAGIFFHQFHSPFIYLLLAAAGVSLAMSHLADALFICAVLLSNAGIGTYQEARAEARARALKSLILTRVAVRRGGVLRRVSGADLVPGDVVQMESGERVAADMRVLEAVGLSVDESLLTGESGVATKRAEPPVPADAGLGDRLTMLHAGTVVQSGRGLCLVVATGRDSVVGQLAAALETPQQAPPLVQRMARFTRHLALATLVLIGLIAALEALRGAAPADILLIGIALAVSAIPEGLPVAMTVALSIAMQRMGKRNVVVRYMPAVEGLGACTLIATDKTGTLTLNKLTLARLWLPGRGDVAPEEEAGAPLVGAGLRASEWPATQTGADGSAQVHGDAVDLAFFACATAAGDAPEGRFPAEVGRVPYEPEKRFAASFHTEQGAVTAYVKGAPETVAALCGPVDPPARAAALRLSAEGYRVIAVAAGRVGAAKEDALHDLTLLGFAGLIDPLRPEAAGAVAAARDAGIRVVMVTGDHPLTALAISRQLGLAETEAEVVTGRDLSGLSGPALDARVGAARVFARIEPLQKLAIVESFKRQGHVVAVTGDGINDAAALHAADIGVAMGRGGTDVARDAADLILIDDNFASIIGGVEEGRIAYDNLRKVILLLVSTGAAEILLMLLASLTGLPPPLNAVQLLWLNLVTNGMQDVALAFERGEPDILKRRPRPPQAPVFDAAMMTQVLLGGAVIGGAAFAFYALALAGGMAQGAAQGAVLWLLVWCENAHCFNARSETRSVFTIPLADNWLLIGAVVGTQLLQVLVLMVPPLRDMLSLEAMTLREGLGLAGVGVLVIGVMELYKWGRRTWGDNGGQTGGVTPSQRRADAANAL